MWRVCFSALDCFLKSDAVRHAAHRVLSLKFLKLRRSVLIQKLIERQVTTANSDLDLILDTLDHDALCTKLVNSLRLTHEHDLELLAVGVVIDVLRQFLIDRRALHRNVDCDT